MENLQYVQKKMTMSFNRKYTSDITYSFLFLSNIYYLQYKTSLHTRSSHSVTANTKQSLHIDANHSYSPIQNKFLNTRAAVIRFKHTQYEHVESEKARMYNTEHFSEIRSIECMYSV